MRASYLTVLGSAVCCYAALGAIVRVVPDYVGGTLGASSFAVGFAIGAPALTAVVTRPLGGGAADRRGTRLIVSVGAAAMAAGSTLMFVERLTPFVVSRLLVGAGEGAMMSATVLWLLRLSGPERRGRALGHVGLANYAGLTLGPLLADALGGSDHPARIFALAGVLPLLPLLVLGRTGTGDVPQQQSEASASRRELAALVLGPGVGLLLVNVGYAALLAFGAAAVTHATVVVLPLYALTVILVRTFAAGVPDRLGGRRTLSLSAPTAAAGLLLVSAAPTTVVALAGVFVLGLGQGFAVPALGLLALAPVPEAQHGAASGTFFAWFDAGVGIGGPLAGAAAAVGGAHAAVATSAAAVALAAPVTLWLRRQTAESSSSAFSSSGG
jgi:MFS family permease